jgi:4-hydroxybenzoate polyprenyltransferase|tara:strand:- start:367 stop:609 length:243 start_codon:yes stop_codon:yes gene_type:complete
MDQLFLYLTFVLLFSNYNFVVEKVLRLKNLFVAVVTIIPVWIVADLIALDSTRFVLMASLLLYIVGRELLMDVQDMEGDG